MEEEEKTAVKRKKKKLAVVVVVTVASEKMRLQGCWVVVGHNVSELEWLRS